MNASLFLHFFSRDLDQFAAEIEAFPSEESLWRRGGEVKNSGGTLALHIAGNLQHFFGAVLGGTGYARHREREFSARNISKMEILAGLQAARKAVSEVLENMNDAQLDNIYPASHFGENRSNGFVFLQLLAHLNYHLGQVNYLRRLTAAG